MGNFEQLIAFVENKTAACRVLVIGDVMLDKYYYGEVTRISPEAPVPITRVTRQQETLGGAANVAHNLALMGAQVSLSGFVGDDFHCQSLLHKLDNRGIKHDGLITVDTPTTTKLRVIGGHQQMLRLDFEDTTPIKGEPAAKLLANLRQQLALGLDMVIISDYGKGACTEAACQQIISLCHEQGIRVVIDPKGKNWNKYIGADYISPNLKELNEVLEANIKNDDRQVETAARFVMGKYQLKNILSTRSEAGLSLIAADSVTHIPTQAQEVFDVSGAGDTVIAVFALALAGGITPADAAYLANLAASVVVAKLGTYAVSKEELAKALRASI